MRHQSFLTVTQLLPLTRCVYLLYCMGRCTWNSWPSSPITCHRYLSISAPDQRFKSPNISSPFDIKYQISIIGFLTFNLAKWGFNIIPNSLFFEGVGLSINNLQRHRYSTWVADLIPSIFIISLPHWHVPPSNCSVRRSKNTPQHTLLHSPIPWLLILQTSPFSVMYLFTEL